MNKIRVGVIGAGFISQVAHIRSLSHLQKCKLVAIADARSSLVGEVAKKFSIPHVFNYYEDMLQRIELDAIIVCLPRRCLGPAVATVLESGLSVLSEKPMAQTLKDATNLVSIAHKNKVNYYIGFMRRCDAGVNLFKDKLQSWIKGKSHGKIIHVAMLDFCGEYAVRPPCHIRTMEKSIYRYSEGQIMPEEFPKEWSIDYEYSLNVLIHDVNLVRYLFNMDVTARMLTVNPGHSQTAILNAGCFDIVLSVGNSKLGKWDQVLHVYFEEGRLSLYLPSPLAQQQSAMIEELSEGKTSNYSPEDSSWAFEKQAELFIEGQTGGNSLSSHGQDSLKDLVTIDNLWRLKNATKDQ